MSFVSTRMQNDNLHHEPLCLEKDATTMKFSKLTPFRFTQMLNQRSKYIPVHYYTDNAFVTNISSPYACKVNMNISEDELIPKEWYVYFNLKRFFLIL